MPTEVRLPTPATEPEHIAIAKSKGVHIDWKDGHQSEYPNEYLRLECPCATCAGTHGTTPLKEQVQSPFPMFKPVVKIVDVEAVGNYAIRIRWSDGHATGIYSFDLFRRICPCAECAGARMA